MVANIEGLREPLRTIVKEIIAEGRGRISVISGARTHEEQASLRNRYLAGDPSIPIAAAPGHSLHERGMAVDFGGDMSLVRRLAAKYGLINSVAGDPAHFTLGGDKHYEGDPNFQDQGIQYNLNYQGEGPPASPQAVLANRIQSITRILGQDPSGVGTPASTPMDVLGDSSPYTSVQNPVPATQPSDQLGTNTQVQPGQSMAPTTTESGSKLQQYAHSLFAQYGFSDKDFPALIELWNRESGWNPMAANPHSTARGIAQKLTSVNGPIESTPEGQIQWGLNYIKNRYGSPSNALAFHDRHNWY